MFIPPYYNMYVVYFSYEFCCFEDLLTVQIFISYFSVLHMNNMMKLKNLGDSCYVNAI